MSDRTPSPLLPIVLGRVATGLWRTGPIARSDLDLAIGCGFEVAETDIARASKAELMGTMAATLDFAEWFGHNWDAADEALTDWAVDNRGIWVVRGFEDLRAAEPGLADTLVEVAGGAFGHPSSRSWCLLADAGGPTTGEIPTIVGPGLKP